MGKKQGRTPTIRKLHDRAGTARQLLKSEAESIKALLTEVENLKVENKRLAHIERTALILMVWLVDVAECEVDEEDAVQAMYEALHPEEISDEV